MELFRINNIQKDRLQRLYTKELNWTDVNTYFEYMKDVNITNVADLVEFVYEKGNAVFNHLRYSLKNNVEWNKTCNSVNCKEISNELRTENMLYRYVWLYGTNDNIEIIDRGYIWYEDEELCRNSGKILKPSLDYPESELSHMFLSVESMPLCTDHLLCHIECNGISHKNDFYRNCSCIPNEIDVDYGVDDSKHSKLDRNYNKCVKSEEIKKINTSNGIRVEEYVYNQDYKEKVKEKKGQNKTKWMCWK